MTNVFYDSIVSLGRGENSVFLCNTSAQGEEEEENRDQSTSSVWWYKCFSHLFLTVTFHGSPSANRLLCSLWVISECFGYPWVDHWAWFPKHMFPVRACWMPLHKRCILILVNCQFVWYHSYIFTFCNIERKVI